MNYILTSLIGNSTAYKIFSSDDEFNIDIEERNLLGYFGNEEELANLLADDNFDYWESPELAREDAKILMEEFELGY